LRDAESLLDQLGSSSSMRITANDVREALGATDSATVKSLIEGLIAKDPSAGFEAIQMAMDQGADARQVAKQMVDYLRALMQVKASANPGTNADQTLSEAEKVELAQHAEHMSMAQISKATRAFSNAINEMRTNTDAQLALEMAYLDCIVVEDVGTGVSSRPADVPAPRPRPTSIDIAPAPASTATPSAPANGTNKPPEPAAEPTAPRSTSKSLANIETVRSNWKTLIGEVNAMNKAAAALLRSCHPHDLAGHVVQLKADHDLIKQRLDDAKNKAAVVAVLKKLLDDDAIGLLVFVGQPPLEPDDDPVLKAAKRLGGTIRAE
jgi:DNA polymerase III subunit gamma/tau